MGAKLSKKKKGYCLGAGKDGESTDTTEVEQKETETQAGQKDAAEPNGEKNPTDQTLKNDASEEQKVQAEKNSTEVQSGDFTKDGLNKDQKSESKHSAEQKKVEEPNKGQNNPEHTKSSNTSQQMEAGDGKGKSQPDKKPQTDHDKNKESVAKDEPTQEPKLVAEQSSEPKQSATEPSAPVPEQNEVAKPVADPETKVKIEKMEKEQTPVLITERVSEHVIKTPVPDSMKKPVKVPEIVETLVSTTALVEPVSQESITVPVAEQVEPEPVNKAVEPETTEVSLPETIQATELVKPEPDLAPVTESIESKVSEEPVAPVPEVKNKEPAANPELAPCAEPEPLSETKQGTKPLPSNEVPDSTAQVEDNVNCKTLGNADLVIETVETQAATTESAPSAEKHPDRDAISENSASEHAVEETQESKARDTISKEQEVEDKEVQKDVKEEERFSDKQPTEHESLEKGEGKDTEEVAIDATTNENDQILSEAKTIQASQDKNVEDKAENHETPAEDFSIEPSVPLIVDKHGVGNGLPVKEEVKVHLENGCDKDLHELNGQGECREIEICNE